MQPQRLRVDSVRKEPHKKVFLFSTSAFLLMMLRVSSCSSAWLKEADNNNAMVPMGRFKHNFPPVLWCNRCGARGTARLLVDGTKHGKTTKTSEECEGNESPIKVSVRRNKMKTERRGQPWSAMQSCSEASLKSNTALKGHLVA